MPLSSLVRSREAPSPRARSIAARRAIELERVTDTTETTDLDHGMVTLCRSNVSRQKTGTLAACPLVPGLCRSERRKDTRRALDSPEPDSRVDKHKVGRRAVAGDRIFDLRSRRAVRPFDLRRARMIRRPAGGEVARL